MKFEKLREMLKEKFEEAEHLSKELYFQIPLVHVEIVPAVISFDDHVIDLSKALHHIERILVAPEDIYIALKVSHPIINDYIEGAVLQKDYLEFLAIIQIITKRKVYDESRDLRAIYVPL